MKYIFFNFIYRLLQTKVLRTAASWRELPRSSEACDDTEMILRVTKSSCFPSPQFELQFPQQFVETVETVDTVKTVKTGKIGINCF